MICLVPKTPIVSMHFGGQCRENGQIKQLHFLKVLVNNFVQLGRNVISRSLEIILNKNLMKHCNNGSPSEVQHVPK